MLGRRLGVHIHPKPNELQPLPKGSSASRQARVPSVDPYQLYSISSAPLSTPSLQSETGGQLEIQSRRYRHIAPTERYNHTTTGRIPRPLAGRSSTAFWSSTSVDWMRRLPFRHDPLYPPSPPPYSLTAEQAGTGTPGWAYRKIHQIPRGIATHEKERYSPQSYKSAV
jgi:hypothetical protein